MQKVWAIASEKTADDCMGLTYAGFLQPASLCGLGLSWITRDTLKNSIERLVRYQRAIPTAMDFSFNELDDCYQVVLRSKVTTHPLKYFSTKNHSVI
ncbi:MAG TPA: hypothetical protein ENJ08_03125 [Gammaproteobacteria bacterium]|nr:hypothetical protein [Gammaproteobacteria bacterium]